MRCGPSTKTRTNCTDTSPTFPTLVGYRATIFSTFIQKVLKVVNPQALSQVMKYLNENSKTLIQESSEKNVVLSEAAKKLLDEYDPQETDFLHRFLIRPNKKGIRHIQILSQKGNSGVRGTTDTTETAEGG